MLEQLRSEHQAAHVCLFKAQSHWEESFRVWRNAEDDGGDVERTYWEDRAARLAEVSDLCN